MSTDYSSSILEMPFLSEDYCFPFDTSFATSTATPSSSIAYSTPITSSSDSYSLYSTSPQELLMAMPSPVSTETPPCSSSPVSSYTSSTTTPVLLDNKDFFQLDTAPASTPSTNINNDWMFTPTTASTHRSVLPQFELYQLEQDPDVFAPWATSPASYLTAATQALTGHH
ncbi:hypothetical protein BGZ52_004936, partial [Haplosporangium bisporale]